MFEQNPLTGPGTGNFTSHLLEIIIMLAIAALLGYLLGRLFANGKWRSIVNDIQGKLDLANNQNHQLEIDVRQHLHRVEALESDLKENTNKLVFLQEDLTYWKVQANKFEGSYNELSDQINALQTSLKQSKTGGKAVVSDKNSGEEKSNDAGDSAARNIGQHDLERIEGIGPKINELLQSKGINTFEELASTDLSALIDIISPMPGSEMFEPSSWIHQARLASENNFEGLDDYQAHLIGGRDPAVNDALNTSSEYFGSRVVYNDLKLLEGIGPKIEDLFNANGIYTWAKLAGTSVARCREILEFGGSAYTMHDPTTWPEQAALAASLDWAGLKNRMDELQGGRV